MWSEFRFALALHEIGLLGIRQPEIFDARVDRLDWLGQLLVVVLGVLGQSLTDWLWGHRTPVQSGICARSRTDSRAPWSGPCRPSADRWPPQWRLLLTRVACWCCRYRP